MTSIQSRNDIENVFNILGLPLIERSIEDIENAKDSFLRQEYNVKKLDSKITYGSGAVAPEGGNIAKLESNIK